MAAGWLLAALLAAGMCSVLADRRYHDYCVVGAGPSGLQLGYFLERAGRNYVIFERSNISGSFYTHYPRHRKLISINKRNTGISNAEFNMRHDWNSLISDDPSLLFRHYSEEMFPPADALVDYLRDFQQKLGIKVRFNTDIRDIRHVGNSSAPDGHIFHMEDQQGNGFACRTLVLATGMWKPNIPSLMEGIELTVGYEDMSTDPEDYEGKTVLILGRGNAAMETADSIYGHTNFVHMVGRSRVRIAWETHYVGDVRAVNVPVFDTYHLKSMDGIMEVSNTRTSFQRAEDGKVRLLLERDEDVGELGTDNYPFARVTYDKVIRCMGFTFDTDIFANKSEIVRDDGLRRKYPAINHDFEFKKVPGMFLAGTASHSLDHRKSAGGFIHGFRYTARALFRLLESRYEGVPWPSKELPLAELLPTLLKRINEASGTYQMFSVLGDVVLLKNNNETFEYLEEFPIRLLPQLAEKSGHAGDKVIVMVMQFDPNFGGPGKDVFHSERDTGEPAEAHRSAFAHPVLYYYQRLPTELEMQWMKKGEVLPRPTLLHHIVQDVLTFWQSPIAHTLPLRRFLEFATGTQLRRLFAPDCLSMAMTHTSLPQDCHTHFLEGAGLVKVSLRPGIASVGIGGQPAIKLL